MLNFLGIGSAFNSVNIGSNSAYFESVTKEDLLVIDMGSTVFGDLYRNNLLDRAGHIYVLITHLHPDHIASLGDLIFYSYLVLNKKIKIIFPQHERLKALLKLMGVKEETYDYIKLSSNLISFSGMSNSLRDAQLIGIESVKVQHVETIDSFGYAIRANNKTIYFSGDSNEIPKEILNSFLNNNIDIIYQDTSSMNYEGNPHMYLGDLEEVIPRDYRDRVYCMHIDDISIIEEIKEKGFNVPAITNSPEQDIKHINNLIERVNKGGKRVTGNGKYLQLFDMADVELSDIEID